MLVNTKARIGVFSIALGAYLPQFPSLVPEFEAQYEAFKKMIPDTVELIDGGLAVLSPPRNCLPRPATSSGLRMWIWLSCSC